VEKNPDDYASAANYAIASLKTGDKLTAKKYFEKALALAPESNAVRLEYAQMLFETGEDKSSTEEYLKYLEQGGNSPKAFYNLAMLYETDKNYSEAISMLQKGLAIYPENEQIKTELAKAYHTDKNYPEALKLYDELLVKNPGNRNLKFNKALVCHAKNNYDDAITLYNDLYKERPDDKVKTYMTRAYISSMEEKAGTGDYSKAISVFENSSKYGLEDADLYVAAAKIYNANGAKTKAVECCEKALALNSSDKTVLTAYAKILMSQGKNEEAQRILSNVANAQDATVEDKYSTFITLGEQYYDKKEFEKAKTEFEKALVLHPDNDALLVKTGNCEKQLSKVQKAYDYYKKAIFVNPKNPDATFNCGLCAAEMNKPAEAKEMFNKTVELKPDYAYGYYALALAFEKETNYQKALENYELFVKNSDDKSVPSSIKTRINELKKSLSAGKKQ
ncbi:MAG: tetratricopeptide repeat protein, partial [Candidatus Gastranaerophilaceae bacterium]